MEVSFRHRLIGLRGRRQREEECVSYQTETLTASCSVWLHCIHVTPLLLLAMLTACLETSLVKAHVLIQIKPYETLNVLD